MKLKDIPDLTLDQVLGNARLLIDCERPELAESLERYYCFLIGCGQDAVNKYIGQFLGESPLHHMSEREMQSRVNAFVFASEQERKHSLYFWVMNRIYGVQIFKREDCLMLLKYQGYEMDFFFENSSIVQRFYERRFCLVSIN